MPELDADTLTIETATTDKGTQVTIEPDYLNWLREHNYRIEGINEVHAVTSSSSDSSHIVMNISTYDRPHDSEKLDLVEDEIDLWICDCGDYTYRKSANIEDGLTKPSQSKSCKHIRSISKVEKAKEDPDQTEIYGEL